MLLVHDDDDGGDRKAVGTTLWVGMEEKALMMMISGVGR